MGTTTTTTTTTTTPCDTPAPTPTPSPDGHPTTTPISTPCATTTATTTTTTSTTTTSTTTTREAECALGELGVNGCLDGYVQITSPQVCNDVSSALGLVYEPHHNKDLHWAAALVCNLCTGCTPNTTRVDDCHGDHARWVCCKGNATP